MAEIGQNPTNNKTLNIEKVSQNVTLLTSKKNHVYSESKYMG